MPKERCPLYLERVEKAGGTLDELRKMATGPSDRIHLANLWSGSAFEQLTPLTDGGIIWGTGGSRTHIYKNDQLVYKGPQCNDWQATPDGGVFIKRDRTIWHNQKRVAILPSCMYKWFATQNRGILIQHAALMSRQLGADSELLVWCPAIDLQVDPVSGATFYQSDYAGQEWVFSSGFRTYEVPPDTTDWKLAGALVVFRCENEKKKSTLFVQQSQGKPIVLPVVVSEWQATRQHIFSRDEKGNFYRDKTKVLTLPDEYNNWVVTSTNDIVVVLGNDLYLYPVSVTHPQP